MTDPANEWEWEAFAVSALGAHVAGRVEEARHLWDRAHAIAHDFAADDPRRAASLNNQALGHLTAGDAAAAQQSFEAALDAWQRALTWTESMTLPQPARSSLFHQRMEARHRESFTEVGRHRRREVLNGAIAVTRFNLGLALLHLDEDDRADEHFAAAAETREAACGPSNPELALMLGVLAGRQDIKGATKEAERLEQQARSILQDPARDGLALWRDEQPAEMNDERRLLAAAHLTASAQERDFL